MLAAGIGLRSPWPADEPRFAQVAREMVESGQWLFPMRGGEPYPDKPPLFVWLVALFYLATGQLKVAFLLPSALAGLGATSRGTRCSSCCSRPSSSCRPRRRSSTPW